MTRIGINGFGRMGRLAFRAAWDCTDVAVVHINEIKGGASYRRASARIRQRPRALVETDQGRGRRTYGRGAFDQVHGGIKAERRPLGSQPRSILCWSVPGNC